MTKRLGILWFVLDEASRAKLQAAVPPRFPNKFYHHVTLRYGVKRQEVAQFIDKVWRVQAYAIAAGANTQACRVETNGLPDEYGVPHVTLSTATDIKPFASVAMLRSEHGIEPLDPPIELSGTVEFEYLDQVKD